jgi:two-component system chemotaxis sensor kinase CheA
MSFFSDERMAELREVFFESAQELLQSLNDQALALEKAPHDAELLRDIRRTVHTLKGDSAAVGFSALSALAHELEDALAPECDAVSAAVADVVLAAADEFHDIVQAYRGNIKPPSPNALRAQIQTLIKAPAAQPHRTSQPHFAWSEFEQVGIVDAATRGKCVFNIAVSIDPACPVRGAGVQLLRNALRDCGTILAVRPAEDAPAEGAENVEAAIVTTHDSAWIENRLRIPSVAGAILVQKFELKASPQTSTFSRDDDDDDEQDPSALADELAAVPAPAPQAAMTSPSPRHAGARESTLRVDAARIDDVLNLVGELIIGKSMLLQAVGEFGRRFPKDALYTRLADSMAYQTRVLDDLQKSVMKIRMVPVEQLFRRFPRLVRDLAKDTGKQVELMLAGESTDLDKSILDMLAEPLAHLVRNAVDHGIETPADRAAAGKPPQGTIRLSAYHHAHQVVIEVSDDGRGIDRKRLLSKAIERGIVSAAESGRLTDAEILELAFHPGFSTAERVTQVSGRGVGLDVVRAVADRLKGTVTLSSTPGLGTTFVLRLPLTLAIIKALLFGADDRIYALPLNTVSEITRMNETEFTSVDGRELASLRDRALPIVRLDRTPSRTGKRFVIVISASDRPCGLVVDRLVGEEELVIKALDDPLVATDLVSGASILGDGTVVLVLNVSAVLNRLGRTQPVGVVA